MSHLRPKPLSTPPPLSTRYQGKPSTPLARNQRGRFKFWYDAIIDWMLINPGGSLVDCGKALGRAPETLYAITNTDIFRVRLADRRTDFNLRLADALVDVTSSVALGAMREISKRIADNPAKIPTVQLSGIADKALERLGYGIAPVTQNVTNNTIAVASPSALSEAQQLMRRVQEINLTVNSPSRQIESNADDEVPSTTISSN